MRRLPTVLTIVAVHHRPVVAAVEVLVFLHPSVLKVKVGSMQGAAESPASTAT